MATMQAGIKDSIFEEVAIERGGVSVNGSLDLSGRPNLSIAIERQSKHEMAKFVCVMAYTWMDGGALRLGVVSSPHTCVPHNLTGDVAHQSDNAATPNSEQVSEAP